QNRHARQRHRADLDHRGHVSIGSVITGGFGSFSNVNFVPTLGYGAYDATTELGRPVPVDHHWRWATLNGPDPLIAKALRLRKEREAAEGRKLEADAAAHRERLRLQLMLDEEEAIMAILLADEDL